MALLNDSNLERLQHLGNRYEHALKLDQLMEQAECPRYCRHLIFTFNDGSVMHFYHSHAVTDGDWLFLFKEKHAPFMILRSEVMLAERSTDILSKEQILELLHDDGR